MVIQYAPRPSNNDNENLAVLAEAFERLNINNFVVCLNRCPANYTKQKAKNFITTALN